jgi:hypothetical protein
MTASAVGGEGTYTYQWYTTTGIISGATNSTYDPAPVYATTGYYCVISDASCGTANTSTTTINVYPEITASITNGSSTTICYGVDPGLFTATGGGGTGSYTYLWYENSVTTGVTTQTYDPGALTATSTFYCAISSGSCGPVNSNSITITVNPLTTISGVLTYDNPAPLGYPPYTPMGNVTVELNGGYPATQTIRTDTTGTIGAYSFNVCPNTNYTLVLSTTSKPVGGINATDAAQVNFAGVAPYTINMIQYLAGDVNHDHALNSGDAFDILTYFVNAGTGTSAFYTKWQFWDDSTINSGSHYTGSYTNIPVSVGTGAVIENLYGLCTGDFNGSFVPDEKKAASNTLSLTYGATLQATTGEEFDLPVYTQSSIDVGAVSLIMNFPSDKLQILGVNLADQANTSLMYKVTGDELRIGWYSRDYVSLKAGGKLLTLRVKLLSALDQNEILRFTLAGDQLNELADAMDNVIPDAILNMDLIGSALGINPGNTNESLRFMNYPNPFTGTTTLAYSLPANGNVTIELRNMFGVIERVVMNDVLQTSGDYKLVLNASDLSGGVYIATLTFVSDGSTMTRTIKIVKTN